MPSCHRVICLPSKQGDGCKPCKQTSFGLALSRALGDADHSRASRWGRTPGGRQEAFVTQQPKEQGASNFSMAVNIDPRAKNEGLISVWQQTSRGRGDPSRERHTCVSQGLEPDSPLCVAQGKGRCSSGHFPSSTEPVSCLLSNGSQLIS